jgi:hypothetical protein
MLHYLCDHGGPKPKFPVGESQSGRPWWYEFSDPIHTCDREVGQEEIGEVHLSRSCGYV